MHAGVILDHLRSKGLPVKDVRIGRLNDRSTWAIDVAQEHRAAVESELAALTPATAKAVLDQRDADQALDVRAHKAVMWALVEASLGANFTKAKALAVFQKALDAYKTQPWK